MHRPALLLIIALFTLPAATYAQSAPVDCSQARDPVRCMARQQAKVDCKDQQGRARQQCQRKRLPAPDCSRAEDQERCEMRQQARVVCQDKTGKELRACLNEHGMH